MSTPADAERRLIAADPVPSGTPKPNTAWSSATLLEHIDARSEDMQTQTKPITPKLEPPRPQRSRRLVAAMAAAVAVVVAVAGTIALISNNEDPVSRYEAAAQAGDAQAVLGIFAEAFRVGDVDTALRYADPDIVINTNVAGMEDLPQDQGSRFEWLPGLIAFEAELYGRSEPGASDCFGPNENDFVWCTFTESPDSPLSDVGVTEVTWVGRVEGGLIVTLQNPGVLLENMDLERIDGIFEGPISEFAFQADPEGLATECDPQAAFEQGLRFGSGLRGSTVYSERCGSFLAGFVDEFVAAQGS